MVNFQVVLYNVYKKVSYTFYPDKNAVSLLIIDPFMPSELFGQAHFSIKSLWLVFIVTLFYRNSCPKCKQCKTLIRHGDLRCLIWVYIACK